MYTDNGCEFLDLRPFLTTHGITHLTIPPHTPEHNGSSERRHRHIIDTCLAFLHHSSMPLTYWPYVMAATYVINCLPKMTCLWFSPLNYSLIILPRLLNYVGLDVVVILGFVLTLHISWIDGHNLMSLLDTLLLKVPTSILIPPQIVSIPQDMLSLLNTTFSLPNRYLHPYPLSLVTLLVTYSEAVYYRAHTTITAASYPCCSPLRSFTASCHHNSTGTRILHDNSFKEQYC